MLADGWSAQTVAARLRRWRLNWEESSSVRGSRELKIQRAENALWMMAQERAEQIATGDEDIQALARELLINAYPVE